PLEAERHLALAGAQDQPRDVGDVDVRVEQLQVGARDVDQELVAVVLPQDALERGAHPAQEEAVDLRRILLREEARVHVQVAAEGVLWRRLGGGGGVRRGGRAGRTCGLRGGAASGQ